MNPHPKRNNFRELDNRMREIDKNKTPHVCLECFMNCVPDRLDVVIERKRKKCECPCKHRGLHLRKERSRMLRRMEFAPLSRDEELRWALFGKIINEWRMWRAPATFFDESGRETSIAHEHTILQTVWGILAHKNPWPDESEEDLEGGW